MNIKIEKGIPMPPIKSKWIELISSMKTGDSILVSKKNMSSVRTAAYRNRVKLVVRFQNEDIFRVWRVE
jgi:hypothetical protein